MKKSYDVAVVIPCHNNVTTIGAVISECRAIVDKVIVVNDGSTDLSASAARSRSAEVHSLAVNRGYGHALRFGINLAFEAGYSHVVTLDGDGAHNPSDIASVVASHLTDSNVLTIGNRWAFQSSDASIPTTKWLANKFATHIVNRVSGIYLPDVASGFRVLRNQGIDFLPLSEGFGFSYELIFLTSRVGKIGTAPVGVRYDAREVLLTKQRELLDLLSSCIYFGEDDEFTARLKLIQRLVSTWSVLSIVIPDTDLGRIFLIAHPLEQVGAYAFQRQHEEFVQECAQEFLEL